MKIWTVDAFTSQPYSGNPAAVMIVEEFPADNQCQKIAAEMNLSETAFVKPLDKNHFHIRWFTPSSEVKLCGHATLASAHILHQENLVNAEKISFESLSGPLFVYKTKNFYTLDFPLQKTGPVLDKIFFEKLLGVKIIAVEQAYDDIIIELADEKTLREINIKANQFNEIKYRGIILTAKADNKYDFISRFFAPSVGVDEDPVTGSAHCKLADYWNKKLNKNKFLAFQASKRGGELMVEIKENDRVYITGSAVTIMQGQWLV